jgi:glycine cleavage system H protein
MSVPRELRYTADHEWVRRDGSTLTVGITDFAQRALGDVVFVECSSPDARVAAGEPCGEIESTKSVSEVYSPVSGTVAATNDAAASEPALLNRDPYGSGWLFVLEPDDADSFDTLLDAAAYEALIAESDPN